MHVKDLLAVKNRKKSRFTKSAVQAKLKIWHRRHKIQVLTKTERGYLRVEAAWSLGKRSRTQNSSNRCYICNFDWIPPEFQQGYANKQQTNKPDEQRIWTIIIFSLDWGIICALKFMNTFFSQLYLKNF